MSIVESNLVLWQMLVLTAVSFGVGILGGFVGLALGTMRLPAMLLMGMPAPAAGGTNILVSSLASLSGALRHLREGVLTAVSCWSWESRPSSARFWEASRAT